MGAIIWEEGFGYEPLIPSLKDLPFERNNERGMIYFKDKETGILYINEELVKWPLEYYQEFLEPQAPFYLSCGFVNLESPHFKGKKRIRTTKVKSFSDLSEIREKVEKAEGLEAKIKARLKEKTGAGFCA